MPMSYRPALLLVLVSLLGLARAEIAQAPLVSQTWVPPNVMVTMDDSGSMSNECIPEALCLNTTVSPDLNIGSVWRPRTKARDGTYDTSAVDLFLTRTVSYDESFLYARQMRSSTTNATYYNPRTRYLPWRKADGSSYPNANVQAAPYDPVHGTTTLDLSTVLTKLSEYCTTMALADCTERTETFDPAQYYVQTEGTLGTSKDDFVPFKINSDSGTFTKYPDRKDCAQADACSKAEELQNFANWFTYYRNKWLAAKAAVFNTFGVIPAETRLGYGVISKSTERYALDNLSSVDGEKTGTLVRGVRPFNGSDRTDFYNWLLNLNIDNHFIGTPLRGALKDVGSYYMRTDNAGPWADQPGGSSTTAHIICRRALHLLITDGGWTGSSKSQLQYARLTSGGALNQNGLWNQNVDGTYEAPFGDRSNNTLADVAMYYWQTNLRSDVAGSATAVTVNAQEAALGREATWPHLVNYMISFGVQGTLANPGDVEALKAGTKTWPVPNSESSKVDDLWHAAWNSGGLYFNAKDPKVLGESLATVIDSMRQITSTDVPLVLPSRFASSEFTYVPSYQTKSWSGELQAYPFDTQTGDRAKTSTGDYAAPVWSAADRLRTLGHAQRKIFTRTPSGSETIRFDYASLKAKGLDSLLHAPDDAQAADMVNYLRGKPDLEGTRYRARPYGLLGDIVNSPPLLVFDGEDASYDFLPPPRSGTRGNYRQFLQYKKQRRGLVFVGANDGMLHAFNAKTGDEEFAYIPKTNLDSVYKLSEPTYPHRYFVDGPLVEADVYDSSLPTDPTTTGWRNVVIGTGGAGARNLFAINVPVKADGQADTAYAPGVNDVLWEVNSSESNFQDLGAVFQKPAVGVMRDGSWVVVVGNGYVDNNGSAKLYILNAMTGALIKAIAIPTNGNNGLGGVRLVLDLQRQITAAYAGDLQGNLWKFDFSGNQPSDWGIAFGGKALYKAMNSADQVEPITATPAYMAHPQGGNLVLFGTGKLYEAADVSNNQVQSLYGVWDKVFTGESSATSTDAISTASSGAAAAGAGSALVEQTISRITGTNYYSASTKLVSYPEKRGWFIRLNMAPMGLRLVFAPQLAVGKVFFQALSPMGDAANLCAQRQGKSVNFVVNPFSGSASPSIPTFDVNGDGAINAADTAYNGNPINAVAVATTDTGSASFSQKLGAGLSTGALSSTTGQQSVTGARNVLRRTWRQIISRPRPPATPG